MGRKYYSRRHFSNHFHSVTKAKIHVKVDSLEQVTLKADAAQYKEINREPELWPREVPFNPLSFTVRSVPSQPDYKHPLHEKSL